MTTDHEAMEALTTMLAVPPLSDAGVGIEHLCRQSAQKAVNHVLDAVLQGATDRDGIIRLRYTEVSEGALRDIVRRAIDQCTE